MKKTKHRKTQPEIPSALGDAGDVDWKPLYRVSVSALFEGVVSTLNEGVPVPVPARA